uniref:Uncharacterized protein n=1 Tax=Anopheles coluzzii TaxID=1518534 RepID=A0A8W7PYJ9_ANOCL
MSSVSNRYKSGTVAESTGTNGATVHVAVEAAVGAVKSSVGAVKSSMGAVKSAVETVKSVVEVAVETVVSRAAVEAFRYNGAPNLIVGRPDRDVVATGSVATGRAWPAARQPAVVAN